MWTLKLDASLVEDLPNIICKTFLFLCSLMRRVCSLLLPSEIPGVNAHTKASLGSLGNWKDCWTYAR